MANPFASHSAPSVYSRQDTDDRRASSGWNGHRAGNNVVAIGHRSFGSPQGYGPQRQSAQTGASFPMHMTQPWNAPGMHMGPSSPIPMAHLTPPIYTMGAGRPVTQSDWCAGSEMSSPQYPQSYEPYDARAHEMHMYHQQHAHQYNLSTTSPYIRQPSSPTLCHRNIRSITCISSTCHRTASCSTLSMRTRKLTCRRKRRTRTMVLR